MEYYSTIYFPSMNSPVLPKVLFIIGRKGFGHFF